MPPAHALHDVRRVLEMALMADKKQMEKRPKRGCLAQLFFLFSAALSPVLAIAIAVMLLPQDLSDIEGYGPGAQAQEARDLGAVLRESLERGHEITITEEELNRWIGQTLKIEQKGLLGFAVKINGIGVRISEDQAEIVIERSFLGLKSTHSMFMQVLVESDAVSSSKEVILHGGPIANFFTPLKRGGRFGRLTVPQGYLYLVKPCFFQLGETCGKELEMAFGKMHSIRLEEGKLVLTPRQAASGPNQS